jgi:hypothetical protein
MANFEQFEVTTSDLLWNNFTRLWGTTQTKGSRRATALV